MTMQRYPRSGDWSTAVGQWEELAVLLLLLQQQRRGGSSCNNRQPANRLMRERKDENRLNGVFVNTSFSGIL